MIHPPPERAARRMAWTRSALGDPGAELVPASSDASFRSYWRVRSGGTTRIVMDAPPELEDSRAWLDIGARLRAAGLHAPQVLARDLAQGFLLIEDLGSTHYLDVLDDGSVERLYGEACDALLTMQTRVDRSGLPPYDAAFLARELALMPEWFLERHLAHTLSADERDTLVRCADRLVAAILEQPVTFVHRDFHSRNLLVTAEDGPGIIDFQGALAGPLTYDLASLLRDCYIAWPSERVDAWAEAHRARLLDAGVLDRSIDRQRFLRWFDLTGLQRHLKVLGIFCRLAYRDGKPGYLDDLPRVFAYVREVAARHPETAPLAALLEARAGGRDLRTARAA